MLGDNERLLIICEKILRFLKYARLINKSERF
jgi:hypothetical protein